MISNVDIHRLFLSLANQILNNYMHVSLFWSGRELVYWSIMNYVLLSNLENLKYSVILKHPNKSVLMKNAYLFDREKKW